MNNKACSVFFRALSLKAQRSEYVPADSLMNKAKMDELLSHFAEIDNENITKAEIQKILSKFTKTYCQEYCNEAQAEIDAVLKTLNVEDKFMVEIIAQGIL